MAANMKLVGTEPAEAPKKNRSPSVRWSKKLITRGKGFTPVSNFFLQNYHRLNPGLTSAEVVVLIHLFSYKWDEEMPYPGSKAIAERMDISVTAVRGHLRVLEKRKKCLVRHRQIGSTNRYDLSPLIQKLEKLLIADIAAAESKKAKKAAVA
jgi:hypothetical protein